MENPFSFNPFHLITSRDSSLKKRNLRLSFGLKVSDFFSSLSGASLAINELLRATYFNISSRPMLDTITTGLVSYLTGLTLTLIMLIGMMLIGLSEIARIKIRETTEYSRFISIPLRILVGLISAPFTLAGAALTISAVIAELTLAAIFTLISLPVLWIIHRKTSQEGEELKKILKAELEITSTYNTTFINNNIIPARTNMLGHQVSKRKYIPLGRDLFDYSTDKDKIDKIRLIEIDNIKFKMVSIFLSEEYDNYNDKTFLLFRDNEEGRAAFDAFIKLNIFNYDEFITTHPLTTESTSNSTLVVNRTIEQITQQYTPLSLDKSGKIEKTDNIFNYLPLELITDIADKAVSDFTGIKPEEKLSLINHATLKFKIETTDQEKAEEPISMDDESTLKKQNR